MRTMGARSPTTGSSAPRRTKNWKAAKSGTAMPMIDGRRRDHRS